MTIPRTELAVLRDAVRDTCADILNHGGGTTREIVVEVQVRHGELVTAAGERLAYAALSNMVRQEMKRGEALGAAAARQMALPGLAKDLIAQLPAAISIPTDAADEDDRIRWAALGSATIDELGKHIGLLIESIRADRAKLRALQELFDMALALADGDRSVTVEEALAAPVTAK